MKATIAEIGDRSVSQAIAATACSAPAFRITASGGPAVLHQFSDYGTAARRQPRRTLPSTGRSLRSRLQSRLHAAQFEIGAEPKGVALGGDGRIYALSKGCKLTMLPAGLRKQ